jgi:hypothetical protein
MAIRYSVNRALISICYLLSGSFPEISETVFRRALSSEELYNTKASYTTEERYTERKPTLDNLNFCVTSSTHHAKFPNQCRRWNGLFQKRSILPPRRKFLPSGGGGEKKLFLIIVNVLGHPKGVGGLTSYFLRGGGMNVFWNDPIS